MNYFAKHKSIGKIIRICLIVLAPIVLFVVLAFPVELYVQAYRNKNYLNNITVLEGYTLDSSARPDGDRLTASDALAKAEIDVDDTLENLYKKIMRNLQKQGYTGDGYTNKTSSNHDIYFKTLNGNKSIVVEYKFAQEIDCSVDNNFKEFCDDRQYVTLENSGAKTMRINKIKVIYDNDDKESYQE